MPGVLAGLLLMLTVWIIARRRGYRANAERIEWARVGRAAWHGKWALAAPLVILGGIYAGAFTPTEAAAVAVFYALFVGALVYRELTLAAHRRIDPRHRARSAARSSSCSGRPSRSDSWPR